MTKVQFKLHRIDKLNHWHIYFPGIWLFVQLILAQTVNLTKWQVILVLLSIRCLAVYLQTRRNDKAMSPWLKELSLTDWCGLDVKTILQVMKCYFTSYKLLVTKTSTPIILLEQCQLILILLIDSQWFALQSLIEASNVNCVLLILPWRSACYYFG